MTLTIKVIYGKVFILLSLFLTMSKHLSGLEKKIAGKADFEAYEKHMHPDHQDLMYNEIEEVLYGKPKALDKNPGASNKAYQALHRITGDPKKDEIKNKKHAEQVLTEYMRYFLKEIKPEELETIDKIEDEKDRLETLISEFDFHSGFGNSKYKSVRTLIAAMSKDKKAKKYIREMNKVVKEHYIDHFNDRFFNEHIPETARFKYADFLRQKLKKKGKSEEKKSHLSTLPHDLLRKLHHEVLGEKENYKQYGIIDKKKKK